ncbi:MAG: spondin domain-containing protein [Acidobacteria bacterium]|nr:spondin domain-containing protein [Acidobacteriota bacterium]
MRTNIFRMGVLPAALVACSLFSVPVEAQITTSLTVTVTNITKGQILSPVVVVTHRFGAPPVFTPGQPAGAELVQVAEDAVLQPLIDKLTASGSYLDVKVIFGKNGPILPGETASVKISSNADHRQVSLVGMLVTTNDTFVGLSGVRRPAFGTESHYAIAYDAGSEANTELCTDIPGPPCGNPGVRVTEGAEGYVYVSPGITGSGDLEPSSHTWLNPAAYVSIQR